MGEDFDEDEEPPLYDRRYDHRRRNHRDDHYRCDAYDRDGRRNRRHGDRSPDQKFTRPKAKFPRFNGGDPHEWLDKAEHYFSIYDVPRNERIQIACFYLDDKASKWWRWLKALYEREHKRLGWTAFVEELLAQWGPSPSVNHHGQLAKLKQEGKVAVYIEEFRQLQTLVRGWSDDALMGTFVDGLKP